MDRKAGRSYAAIHALLSSQGVRGSGDRATVEETVALCENGFGYDVAMFEFQRISPRLTLPTS
jgi:hypothetical protein